MKTEVVKFMILNRHSPCSAVAYGVESPAEPESLEGVVVKLSPPPPVVEGELVGSVEFSTVDVVDLDAGVILGPLLVDELDEGVVGAGGLDCGAFDWEEDGGEEVEVGEGAGEFLLPDSHQLSIFSSLP